MNEKLIKLLSWWHDNSTVIAVAGLCLLLVVMFLSTNQGFHQLCNNYCHDVYGNETSAQTNGWFYCGCYGSKTTFDINNCLFQPWVNISAGN